MKEDIAIVFLLFLLFPSFKISDPIRRPFPGHLPKKMAPGSPMVIREIPGTAAYHLSGRAMSKIGRNYYLGAIDLYQEKFTYISGVFTSEDTPESYFASAIPLTDPKVAKPVILRFPSSVQKNVLEADASKKEMERDLLHKAMEPESGSLQDFCWSYPLKSKPVGSFGSARYLPNNKIYFHGGLDLRAKTGTQVFADADGKVAFAEKLIVPGNVVVLYHGSGLYSMSMHLSQLLVKTGDEVKKGQLIALSGDTGRVEGPHLHWETRWKGISLNPLSLVDSLKPLCDPK